MASRLTRTLIVLLAALAMMFALRLTPTARAEVGSVPAVSSVTWSESAQSRILPVDGQSQAVPETPSEPTALTLVTLSTRTDYSALVIFGGVLLVVAAGLIIVVAWRSQKEARIN